GGRVGGLGPVGAVGGRGGGGFARTPCGNTGEATSGATPRRADRALGLAQGHPVPGGRGERPAGVGGAGGGSLPCVARLGIQRARPYAPPARPCHAAAARNRTGV